MVLLLSTAFGRAQGPMVRKIGLEEGLPTLAINSMVEGPEGYLWMGSEGAGLLRYDGYRFESFFQEDFPLIEDLVPAEGGRLFYMHDGSRMAAFDGLELREIPLPESLRLFDIIEFEEAMFIATDLGIFRWQGDSLIEPSNNPTYCKSLQIVNHTLVGRSDTLAWAWTAKGFQVLPNFRGSLRFGFGKTSFCLQDSSIYLGVLEPKWNPLWPDLADALQFYQAAHTMVVLKDEELVIANDHQGALQIESFPLGPAFSFNNCKQVHRQNGQLVLLTEKGLFLVPENFTKEYPRQIPIMAAEPSDSLLYLATPLGLSVWPGQASFNYKGLILDLLKDEDQLLVATESGLFEQSLSDLKSVRNTPVSGFVFSIAQHNGLTIAASSTGIWKKELGQAWRLLISDEDLSYASIFSIKFADNGTCWLASYTQGIWELNGNEWTHHQEFSGLQLDSMGISALEVLPDGGLLFGTLNSGLFRTNPARSAFEHIHPRDLEFAEIRAFASWDDHILIGTNKGVLTLVDILETSKAGESARIYFSGPPVGAKGMKIRNGILYTAGEQGLMKWDLAKSFALANLGTLGLSELSFLRQQAKDESADFERMPFTGLDLLKDLDHDANYLRFGFGLRSLRQPELVQYRYRLLGQNDEWTYAGTSREALFSDLKAGNYTLEIEGRYPWNNWQLSAEPYVFSIKEAFWRTWWFWTLIITVSLALTFGFFRDRWLRREERLRLENDLLEMERKALRLQMNPHFIFNALDSISSFIFKQDPKMAVRYLNNFAKLMRLTLESSMEHIHPVETEVSILKNYLELEKLRFNSKFDYQIDLDEELDYDIGLPPMLIQPHVENAILHGLKPKATQGNLHISFQLEGDTLCCTVEDDGIGRVAAKDLPNKKAHRSMATKINKDRIDLLKRSMNEVIDLQIIDLYNQQGEAMGTKVLIRLPAQEV